MTIYITFENKTIIKKEAASRVETLQILNELFLKDSLDETINDWIKVKVNEIVSYYFDNKLVTYNSALTFFDEEGNKFFKECTISDSPI